MTVVHPRLNPKGNERKMMVLQQGGRHLLFIAASSVCG
jgi:hypothetical protein